MKEKTEKKIHFAEKSAENALLHFMRPLKSNKLNKPLKTFATLKK